MLHFPSLTEANVVSDDECDFNVTETRCQTTHIAQQDENMLNKPCDSCQYCNDVCDVPSCNGCHLAKCKSFVSHRSPDNCDAVQRLYTPCQIRRHNHIDSAWIVAGLTVYDVTSYIRVHPGGSGCILKKAGGQHDCTRDLQFHSNRGKQLFHKCAIGRVIPCPGCASRPDIASKASTSVKLEKQKWFLW
jgi:cytochrome b involved in lipid metabolism